MTPQESRARLRALATDALRGGYDYEAHEQPYVNLAGCVCTTPATTIALLSELDAAELRNASLAASLREVADMASRLRDNPLNENALRVRLIDLESYAIGSLAEAPPAYDAATTAKEG